MVSPPAPIGYLNLLSSIEDFINRVNPIVFFATLFFLAYTLYMGKDDHGNRVVRVPKLTPKSEPFDVWFEQGMLWHEDPTDPNNVLRCSVDDFEAKIDGLTEMVNRYEEKYRGDENARVVYCGKADWDRFLYHIKELFKYARSQIHIGQSLDIIMDAEARRQPITLQTGLGEGKTAAAMKGGTPSKLIVPES
jgi:hypothetical protein